MAMAVVMTATGPVNVGLGVLLGRGGLMLVV
ncbi:MAG: hypothetical protein RIS48_2174, partial [Pseudomonadota bacterium]